MPEKLGLVLFKESDVKRLVEPIGYHVEESWILNSKDKIARCEVCHDKLSIETLGHVVKGSFKLFCDDPACIMEHLSKTYKF